MSDASYLDKLNPAQRQAVEAIDGPVLVIAGPGTGKTQLLSARVAHILDQTDIEARNILCLTFTESGATNMRERLRNFIGDDAYDVTISTYHSFGSDIIKQYSDYFQTISIDRSDDVRLERPIDELSQIQIVSEIISKLPFDSPLLGARYYIKSVVNTISDLKQNLITPESLKKLANDNLLSIKSAQPILDSIVNNAGGISSKKAQKLAQYDALLTALQFLKGELCNQATIALQKAHQESHDTGSPTPLTKWKNEWLHKDENDKFTLTDAQKSYKLTELANIYQKYQEHLQAQASYDFDDMILRAIEGINKNDELRYNLQERYQYILLDEFQDTNPSQFELVKQIANHPVHEGRPNIMAVGDDDQAIFAFQGANIGNMKEFLVTFSGVTIVNLLSNYRSHADILHVAHGIAGQIEDRLHAQISNINKVLVAESKALPEQATIARHEFIAQASEYSWVADKVRTLVDEGINPTEIAILAPKHKILENIVPFMHKNKIPISYEKRENILETEIVQGIRLCAELIQALNNNDRPAINKYFPLVLSLPFWKIPAQEVWKINWQFSSYDEKRQWPEIALEANSTAKATLFYLSVASTATAEPLEITLDKLIGTIPVINGEDKLEAPLKSYYFEPKNRTENALKYYEAISHLSVIRTKLRDYQLTQENQLSIKDFLDFFSMYEAGDATLTNIHPIAQKTESVQLMTAYKAKGLEFEHVFILQAHDDVWGSASRGGNNKLSLPANLSHIRYVGSSNDERLRLFFVAITRAKHALYITSHSNKDSGKSTTPLKYLSENGSISAHLPEHSQNIIKESAKPEDLAEDIETLWQAGQIKLPADFRSLLKDRLKRYQMSPTHLNSFIDLEHGGPETFLVQTLLRFPQAPSVSGEYGTAIHNSLEWYQNQCNAGKITSIQDVLKQFDYQLKRRYMSDSDRDHSRAKGRNTLQKYLIAREGMFKQTAQTEVNFYNEGVIVGNARLSGKIDRLEIDTINKTIKIADYKTGSPLSKWDNSIKALKYKQQLYFYKLLIEGSHSFRDYSVIEARLEFIEPSSTGSNEIKQPLLIDFDSTEETEMKQLINAVWNIIQTLDLPDVTAYDQTLSGSKQFIKDLSV